jgi:hypothetical protein
MSDVSASIATASPLLLSSAPSTNNPLLINRSRSYHLPTAKKTGTAACYIQIFTARPEPKTSKPTCILSTSFCHASP